MNVSRAEVPGLRSADPRAVSRATDPRGDRLPPASLPVVPDDLDLGTDDAGDGGADRERAGASDPAFDIFRSDYERNWRSRSGYEGADGFSRYLKEAGIVSPMQWRRIRGCTRQYRHEQVAQRKGKPLTCDCSYEITGTDLDRQ